MSVSLVITTLSGIWRKIIGVLSFNHSRTMLQAVLLLFLIDEWTKPQRISTISKVLQSESGSWVWTQICFVCSKAPILYSPHILYSTFRTFSKSSREKAGKDENASKRALGCTNVLQLWRWSAENLLFLETVAALWPFRRRNACHDIQVLPLFTLICLAVKLCIFPAILHMIFNKPSHLQWEEEDVWKAALKSTLWRRKSVKSSSDCQKRWSTGYSLP